jgi:predicted transport protein
MALFEISGTTLTLVRPTNFSFEKQIQSLIERNIGTVFNCRLVASEFPTGQQHAGRIDTLALSEDNNPVIIEYKKIESSELINQSLYYLAWLNDHRGDFQIEADHAIGQRTDVDWSAIRVICIAPGYKKYDLHAVQMMGANIELWQYRLYQNSALHLEEVFRRSTSLLSSASPENSKDPVMVAAGRKAAETRATGVYSFDEHLDRIPQPVRDLAMDLRDFILGLDESVEESPKKLYIAYKVTQNFVCLELQRNRVLLYLKLDPSEVQPLPPNARDVREIGHYGTGDFELSIRSKEEAEAARDLISSAFDRVGGS